MNGSAIAQRGGGAFAFRGRRVGGGLHPERVFSTGCRRALRSKREKIAIRPWHAACMGWMAWASERAWDFEKIPG